MFAAVSLIISMVSVMLYTGFNFGAHSSMITKMISALVFLICGIIAIWISKNNSKYAYLILAGLVCGFIGDFLLASTYDPSFKWSWGFEAGMAFFLAEHILMILALVTIQKFTLSSIITAILIYIPFFILFLLGKEKLGSLLIPMMIYGFILLLVTVKAFSIGSCDINESVKILIISGITLFCISDIILGMNMSFDIASSVRKLIPTVTVKSSYWVDFCNAVTYFLGQTMIACTIFYIKK